MAQLTVNTSKGSVIFTAVNGKIHIQAPQGLTGKRLEKIQAKHAPEIELIRAESENQLQVTEVTKNERKGTKFIFRGTRYVFKNNTVERLVTYISKQGDQKTRLEKIHFSPYVINIFTNL